MKKAALVLSVILFSLAAGAEQRRLPERGPAAELAAASGTSYVACYFRKPDNSVAWQWGLTNNNAYFQFVGTWADTPYTKLKKFSSTALYEDLCAACAAAKTYYKQEGEVFAMFAATTNAGSNYPILLGGNELFPIY